MIPVWSHHGRCWRLHHGFTWDSGQGLAIVGSSELARSRYSILQVVHLPTGSILSEQGMCGESETRNLVRLLLEAGDWSGLYPGDGCMGVGSELWVIHTRLLPGFKNLGWCCLPEH